MDAQNKMRNTILAAAEKRFRHYGFNKTTMAEIASDCEMSAANLYRFFDGKKEILSEIVQGLFSQREAKLNEIVLQSHINQTEKLRLFTRASLDLQYDYYSNSPRTSESIDFICNQRVDLIFSHHDKKKSLLIAILEEGNSNNEFNIDDIPTRAEAILKATVMFHSPSFSICIPMKNWPGSAMELWMPWWRV